MWSPLMMRNSTSSASESVWQITLDFWNGDRLPRMLKHTHTHMRVLIVKCILLLFQVCPAQNWTRTGHRNQADPQNHWQIVVRGRVPDTERPRRGRVIGQLFLPQLFCCEACGKMDTASTWCLYSALCGAPYSWHCARMAESTRCVCLAEV